jgi:hypothetical protein
MAPTDVLPAEAHRGCTVCRHPERIRIEALNVAA